MSQMPPAQKYTAVSEIHLQPWNEFLDVRYELKVVRWTKLRVWSQLITKSVV